jgi:uncharacterized membrane protein YdjX (TVP38/TMEM64 family)
VPPISEKTGKRAEKLRVIALAVFILALLITLVFLPLGEWLDAAAQWNNVHPIAGAVIYLLASVVSAVLFLPGTLIAMSGGYLYGMPLGLAMAALGGALGSIAAFMNGRLFGRSWAVGMLEGHPRLQALDKALNEQSFVIVMLTRLSLVIPYSVLNYLYSVTGVKKVPYMLASAIGLIPLMGLWAYVGTLAKNFDDILSGDMDSGLAGQVLFFVGLGAILLAVWVMHRTASRVLKERLAEANAESDS